MTRDTRRAVRSEDLTADDIRMIDECLPSADELATDKWQDTLTEAERIAQLERRVADLERMRQDTMTAQEQMARIHLAMTPAGLRDPTAAGAYASQLRIVLTVLLLMVFSVIAWSALSN